MKNPTNLLEQGILHILWCGIEDIANNMCLASLPCNALEMLFNGLHQPTVLIRDDQVHSPKSPIFQPSEELAPAGLRFTVSDLQAKNFPISFLIHSCSDQHGSGAYSSILPDFRINRIHQYKRIHVFMKGTVIPVLDNRIQSLAQ